MRAWRRVAALGLRASGRPLAAGAAPPVAVPVSAVLRDAPRAPAAPVVTAVWRDVRRPLASSAATLDPAKINTHPNIDQATCGTPEELREGRATVRMRTTELMAADARGLTHGGYYFGMADYAAMLSVNDPNVVLGSAETKFIKPVKTGDELLAEAVVVSTKGKKRVVEVSIQRDGFDLVFEGTFTCFVLPTHVFDT